MDKYTAKAKIVKISDGETRIPDNDDLVGYTEKTEEYYLRHWRKLLMQNSDYHFRMYNAIQTIQDTLDRAKTMRLTIVNGFWKDRFEKVLKILTKEEKQWTPKL